MVDIHVMKVFTGSDGSFGNVLGICLDEATLSRSQQQRIASDTGFCETVFVEYSNGFQVTIFGPRNELSFAGHPLVGTAWYLANLGANFVALDLEIGQVPVFNDDDGTTWIRGSHSWFTECMHIELPTPQDVELAPFPNEDDFIQIWAWEDRELGIVRARSFAPLEGVAEDEACGLATMILSYKLSRNLIVHHGKGSIILARPVGRDLVDVGGLVVYEGVVQITIPHDLEIDSR